MSDSNDVVEDKTAKRDAEIICWVGIVVIVWGVLGHLCGWYYAPPMGLVEFICQIGLFLWLVRYLRDKLKEAVYEGISEAFENMELLQQLEENEYRIADELANTPPEGHA